MKKRLLTIMIIFYGLSGIGQLYIQQNALVHISKGANLEVGGVLENAGAIQNLGSLSLYDDWLLNNNFNGLEGSINFLGDSNRVIFLRELTVSQMNFDLDGVVSLSGGEYLVNDRINFQFGRARVERNTRFVLGGNVRIVGGSNESYVEGIIINKGSGIKTFPIGMNGVYAPLTLLDVFGSEIEIAATFLGEISVAPKPRDDLLGVSHRSVWELKLLQGIVDDTKVQAKFSQENLSDFKIYNNIRHQINSPVIATTKDLAGEWSSLGVSSILDTDSLTYGTIVAETPIKPSNEVSYLSIALSPLIPKEGLYFIPEVFSPNASNPINRTFKILGEQIVEEDFYLKIFNRLGSTMYETNSFKEANENGWNGINRSGGKESHGIYFYELQLKFKTEQILEKNGFFYMIR